MNETELKIKIDEIVERNARKKAEGAMLFIAGVAVGLTILNIAIAVFL